MRRTTADVTNDRQGDDGKAEASGKKESRGRLEDEAVPKDPVSEIQPANEPSSPLQSSPRKLYSSTGGMASYGVALANRLKRAKYPDARTVPIGAKFANDQDVHAPYTVDMYMQSYVSKLDSRRFALLSASSTEGPSERERAWERRLVHGGVEVIRRTTCSIEGADLPYARRLAEARCVAAVRPEVERITKKGERVYQSYLDVGVRGLPAVHEIQMFRKAHRWGRDHDTEHRLRARKEGDQLTTTFAGWHNVEAWEMSASDRLLVYANVADFADWNERWESPRVLGVPSPWVCHYFAEYLSGLIYRRTRTRHGRRRTTRRNE